MAVVLGAIIIRKCNINTIRSIFLWIRVRLVKSISKRINLKSLKKFYTRTILWGAGLRGGSAGGLLDCLQCHPFLIITKLKESVHHTHGTLNNQPLFGRFFYVNNSHCFSRMLVCSFSARLLKILLVC